MPAHKFHAWIRMAGILFSLAQVVSTEMFPGIPYSAEIFWGVIFAPELFVESDELLLQATSTAEINAKVNPRRKYLFNLIFKSIIFLLHLFYINYFILVKEEGTSQVHKYKKKYGLRKLNTNSKVGI